VASVVSFSLFRTVVYECSLKYSGSNATLYVGKGSLKTNKN